jgi:hypothetical protein
MQTDKISFTLFIEDDEYEMNDLDVSMKVVDALERFTGYNSFTDEHLVITSESKKLVHYKDDDTVGNTFEDKAEYHCHCLLIFTVVLTLIM